MELGTVMVTGNSQTLNPLNPEADSIDFQLSWVSEAIYPEILPLHFIRCIFHCGILAFATQLTVHNSKNRSLRNFPPSILQLHSAL